MIQLAPRDDYRPSGPACRRVPLVDLVELNDATRRISNDAIAPEFAWVIVGLVTLIVGGLIGTLFGWALARRLYGG